MRPQIKKAEHPTERPRDEDIQRLLRECRRVLIVGLSPQSERPSHWIGRYLIDHGYEVYGLNPGHKTILGRPVYETLADVPFSLELVNVFRASSYVSELVDQLIPLMPKAIWLQDGVTDPASEARARQAGIWVISNDCIYREHRRLVGASDSIRRLVEG